MNNDPQRGARRLRRGLAAGAAAVLSAGILVGVAEPASAAPACRVTYQVNAWPGGFNVQSLNITNLGDPITGGWTVTFSYASGQTITQAWNSSFTQSGSNVTIRSAAWN
ncbi:MAG TPA: cellulose binding domain-containing protein, partial [Micromonosporaceae bacterium]|nr:cellulose binding domain-containing protein [Micromonosporaceae bacterium]